MKIKISNQELQANLVGKRENFPKYTGPMLNLANRFAQATRPKIVGQMTELVKPFRSYGEWKKWYLKTHPKELEDATSRILKMLENFKEVINKITSEKVMIKDWIEDLVLVQTYIGIRFQEVILKRIAKESGKNYRVSTPKEESKGIDGFINNIPVSIKPLTYKLEKKRLGEEIKAKIVYYEKLDKGIEFKFDLNNFK